MCVEMSKKDQLKDETTTVSSPSQQQQQREYQESYNRALDETKDNIRKTTDEARREIPRYTRAVGDYQEQTIQASREAAEDYIESQKRIISSFQSAWVPYAAYWEMVSPRKVSELYARTVSSCVDNAIAATRLVNNAIFAGMDVFRTSIQHVKDNAKELSRISTNAAKTFEQT
jgi:hypothetical protein